MAGELGFTVGTRSVVEAPVFNFNVAAQVVLAQALLRAEVTVVDRINLEKVRSNSRSRKRVLGQFIFKQEKEPEAPGESGGKKGEA